MKSGHSGLSASKTSSSFRRSRSFSALTQIRSMSTSAAACTTRLYAIDATTHWSMCAQVGDEPLRALRGVAASHDVAAALRAARRW